MSSNEHEKKFSKKIRSFISFILFLLIVLLSMTVCAKGAFLNKSVIEKQFTSFEYTSGLRNNVSDYAKDVCKLQGISDGSVDDIFSYKAVSEAVSAYFGYYISDKIEYSGESHIKQINSVCDEFKIKIQNQLKADGVKYDEAVVDKIADEINEYFVNAVEMPHMDKAKSVLNVMDIALYAVIGVSAFFVLSLLLIEFFVGTKRQRSVRAIAISFLSAGIYELFFALIIYIISLVRSVDIFPLYLSKQFLSYVYMAISSVAFCGGILIFISVIIIAIVWKMRRED